MADFLRPFERTLNFEGVTLESVYGDPGGLTFCGIARNMQPTWSGWPIVDGYIASAPDFPTAKKACVSDQNLMNLVELFYRAQIWDKYSMGLFFYQELATQVYDAVTNLGGRAIVQLQKLVAVPADGNIGPVSIHAINGYSAQDTLVNLFIVWRKSYYMQLVQEKPEMGKFLQGWLNRCVRSDQ